MSLRILHVLDHSLPLHSGYTFRTLSILREQRKLGWETFHLTSPKQGVTTGLEENVGGLSFFRTPSPEGAGWLNQMQHTAKRLREVIRQTHPHIIHAHSPVLTGLPSLWVGRHLGLPVVYEMRASWEDAAVDHGTTAAGSLRYRLSRQVESFVFRHVDQITTICEGLRGDILQRGIPYERISVIPNAVNSTLFNLDAEPDPVLRQSLGLEGATVIGFVGSFYGYEGLDILVEAVRRLQPRYENLRLLLVGGGPQEDKLKSQVASAGLQDKVVFAGRIEHADVQRYYQLIDLLAYPRRSMRLTELVTPLKPLEAMAQGRMFVASDVGGHRELVQHGKTGFLCQSDNVQALEEAMDEILAKRDQWPSIQMQARRYVELERTWKASVARYREVYQRALSCYEHTEFIKI